LAEALYKYSTALLTPQEVADIIEIIKEHFPGEQIGDQEVKNALIHIPSDILPLDVIEIIQAEVQEAIAHGAAADAADFETGDRGCVGKGKGLNSALDEQYKITSAHNAEVRRPNKPGISQADADKIYQERMAAIRSLRQISKV